MRIKSPVFVGRRAELGRLGEWLAEAREGKPRVVVVGGEAGIGKSRLASEVARLAVEQRMRVLSGAAADYGEGGLPFGAVAEALRPVMSQLPEVGGGQGRLAGTTDEQASQLAAFERLLGRLESLAAEQPTLLTLEDLHWADASTREFVAFLARNLGSNRLLVLGTYRSDDVTRDHPLRRYLAELVRAGRIERLELERFGTDELRQQLEAIAGERLDRSRLVRLFERSGGNPFFAEEVFAVESGGNGRSEAALPETLRDILLTRLEALSEATRRVLEAAAVAGRADDEFMAAVTGLPQGEVLAGLREAITHYVLEPVADPPALGYAFRHALLREAIYDELLAGERVRLHRRVAETMASQLADRPADSQLLAQLAHHWLQARQAEEAFVASWRAARAAEQAHAYPEAALHYEHVLELWPEVADPLSRLRAELSQAGEPDAAADRASVAWRAGRAAGMGGELQREAQLYRAAQAEIQGDTDAARAALLHVDLMEALLDRGESGPARIEHEQALALVDQIESAEVRASVLLRLSNHLLLDYDEQLVGLADAALEAAMAAGSPLRQAEAQLKLARHKSFMGLLDEGMAHFAAARATAADNGLENTVASVDKERAIILECAARFDEALAALGTSQEIWQRVGVLRGVRHNDAMIGQVLHRLGRWPEAEAALERALQPPAAQWAFVVLGYLLVGMGRFDEARQTLERAWPTVQDSHSSASYGPYFSALAEMALWEGRPELALEHIEQAFTFVWDWRWLGEYSRLGLRALADLAAGDRATERLAQLHAKATDAYRSIYAPEVRAAMATADAEASRALGRSDPAGWQSVADGWAELGELYPQAYAMYRQAEALTQRGERAAATDPLGHAARLAHQLGAAPLLEVAQSLARRARISLAIEQQPGEAGKDANDYGLTSREREVLSLLAQGRTDQQIAEELFISPKTASVHVSNIKGKLGVERRIEAAAAGLRLAGLDGENRE